MNADSVLARHTKGRRVLRRVGELRQSLCHGCFMPWGESGCDAVQMAREVKRLREAVEIAGQITTRIENMVWPTGFTGQMNKREMTQLIDRFARTALAAEKEPVPDA